VLFAKKRRIERKRRDEKRLKFFFLWFRTLFAKHTLEERCEHFLNVLKM